MLLHLLHKSRVAGLLLPEVEQVQFPAAVLSLLLQIKELQDTGLHDLLRIAADGKIDPEERPIFDRAVQQLADLIQAALHVQFAKEG